MAKSPDNKSGLSPSSARPSASIPRPAPENTYRITDAQAFGRNMAKVAAKSQQLVGQFLARQSHRLGQEPLDPLNISGAWFALLKQMASNPAAMLNAQFELWRDYATLVQRTAERAAGRKVEPVVAPQPGDR